MNLMKYPTKNDISISNAVLKLAKLQNAERLENLSWLIVKVGQSWRGLVVNLHLEGEMKGAALARHTFNPHLSTHEVDKLSAYRQSQAGTAVIACIG